MAGCACLSHRWLGHFITSEKSSMCGRRWAIWATMLPISTGWMPTLSSGTFDQHRVWLWLILHSEFWIFGPWFFSVGLRFKQRIDFSWFSVFSWQSPKRKFNKIQRSQSDPSPWNFEIHCNPLKSLHVNYCRHPLSGTPQVHLGKLRPR